MSDTDSLAVCMSCGGAPGEEPEERVRVDGIPESYLLADRPGFAFLAKPCMGEPGVRASKVWLSRLRASRLLLGLPPLRRARGPASAKGAVLGRQCAEACNFPYKRSCLERLDSLVSQKPVSKQDGKIDAMQARNPAECYVDSQCRRYMWESVRAFGHVPRSAVWLPPRSGLP